MRQDEHVYKKCALCVHAQVMCMLRVLFVSLVVHAVVGLSAWSHCSCCCRRFLYRISVANFL